MRSISSLTTLKLTSASSSARRICFIASEMFSSVRTACPRRDLKARWSFSWRFSNIRDQHYFNRREDGRRPELSAASHQPSGSSLLFRKHFPCCDHRVAVNGQRVFHIPRVAAGEGDHHGDAASLGDAEDKFVALLQSVNGERQAAELVFAIGIGAGDVAEQLRIELAKAGAERVVEPREIVVVASFVGEVDVDRRWRFPRRVVILLVKRDGEDVSGVAAAHFCLSRGRRGGGYRRQRLTGRPRTGENRGGAIALMDVAID